jgi:hypothetical protein
LEVIVFGSEDDISELLVFRHIDRWVERMKEGENVFV